MCDLDRRTFLKAVPGAAVLAGEFVYAGRAHAQAPPIKIGAPLPLTGPAAPLGQHSLWGTQAALRVIESRGGIAGRPVQLIVEDDGGRPADAVKIMRKMILQDQVDAQGRSASPGTTSRVWGSWTACGAGSRGPSRSRASFRT